MNYHHRFRVKAPLASVAAFHYQQASLALITPPPIRVELHRIPEPFTSGGLMDFTLRFGPLPIRWQASLEEISENGFTDRQISGPFDEWVHRHSFIRVDDETTVVDDRISLRLKPNLLWGAVGLGFMLGLPFLFAFRGWKTRRLLEKGAD
jgi:ligand-binding SRPBCC domain-containing protein